MAHLDHATGATNLLDFILGFIFDKGFDNQDMTQRARLFLLKIMSKTYVEPPPNPDDLENYSFPLLLYVLNYHSLVRDILNMEITLSQELIVAG